MTNFSKFISTNLYVSPARPPPPSKDPTKWVKPPKKRKNQILKKSVSSERQISKSVFRVAHPKGWLFDRKGVTSNNQRVDTRDNDDEIEQDDEQDSDTLSDRDTERHSEHSSDSPPPPIPPDPTQQDELLLEEQEDSNCNATLKLCTNINTTNISDVTENLPGMPTSPLSKRFARLKLKVFHN